MGYTISLASAASQAEGSGATPATFVFNITRLAGDAASDGDNYSFKILNAADFTPSDDFAVNNGAPVVAGYGTWGAGGLTNTITLTANPDTTVEPNETFNVYFYRNSDPSAAQVLSVTLTNDDVGPPVFTSAATLSVAENATAVETATSTGAGTPAYTIVGGADQTDFAITTGGVLTFVGAPDFEAGAGSGATANQYLVTIRSTAGGLTTDQALTVNVTNVDDVLPTVTSAATKSVAENTLAVQTETATTDAASTATTWSISGGADSSKFTIDGTTGALAFAAKPDFEHPTDAGANNVYDLIVQATSSGGKIGTQAVAVTVTDAVEGPVITSGSGAAVVFVHAQENVATTTTVTTLVATAAESGTGAAATYAIAHTAGTDWADFNINATTGVLTFAASPNFEAPDDIGADNVYQLDLTATAGSTVHQTMFVFVDNVVEPGDPVINTGTGTGPVVIVPTGPQLIQGTAAAEYLVAGSGNDTINGNGGTDAIDGGPGNNLLNGGDNNDFIRGLDGNDTVNGSGGDDDVNGNTGNDLVSGGDGSDTVRGGQGDDTVSGGEGSDAHVNGNIGNDIVHGDGGNDTVYGGQGDDIIYGDAGNDQLSGDLGNDLMYGGAGADRFMFARGGGRDWVVDFNAAEGDHIVLAPGTTYTVSSYQGQTMIDLGNGDVLGLAGVPASSFSTSWILFS